MTSLVALAALTGAAAPAHAARDSQQACIRVIKASGHGDLLDGPLAIITGTPRDDWGTDEVIEHGEAWCGFAGNDGISDMWGAFFGGPGNDYGGAENFGLFVGGAGNDSGFVDTGGVFEGGPGDDSSYRMAGTFYGGAGDDQVFRGQGYFEGRNGEDSVDSNYGQFRGGSGDDSVIENFGEFKGGRGDDHVDMLNHGTFIGGAETMTPSGEPRESASVSRPAADRAMSAAPRGSSDGVARSCRLGAAGLQALGLARHLGGVDLEALCIAAGQAGVRGAHSKVIGRDEARPIALIAPRSSAARGSSCHGETGAARGRAAAHPGRGRGPVRASTPRR